ncbi:MAG: hypothetical protein ACPL1G_10440 [Thermodesulfovibrionales bacterium]
MEIVSNSSPLIVLSKIKRIELLRQLFISVYIPEAVFQEVYGVRKERCPSWIQVRKVKDRMAIEALEAIVDKGEAEAIILTKEINTKHILIDDKKGFNLARRMGFEPFRTTTLMGIAYKKELLIDLKAELINLREKGYWITDYYIDEIVKRF